MKEATETNSPSCNGDFSSQEHHRVVAYTALAHGGLGVIEVSAFVRYALFLYWNAGL